VIEMPSKASTNESPRHEPLPLPQARGLNREQAAAYVGVSPSKFDELVKDHFMPPPVAIGARRLWDRHALDKAFDGLANGGERDTSWDGV
jgi:predicted DNA-binding transcriptional regulator AlpA